VEAVHRQHDRRQLKTSETLHRAHGQIIVKQGSSETDRTQLGQPSLVNGMPTFCRQQRRVPRPKIA
jgi:hypothetical protein